MMNRRNIRIKVMQVLYMLETGVAGTPQSLYQKELDKTRNLFLFLVHLLHQVAEHPAERLCVLQLRTAVHGQPRLGGGKGLRPAGGISTRWRLFAGRRGRLHKRPVHRINAGAKTTSRLGG